MARKRKLLAELPTARDGLLLAAALSAVVELDATIMRGDGAAAELDRRPGHESATCRAASPPPKRQTRKITPAGFILTEADQ